MLPMRRYHQSWLPAMFDDFFDNEWMKKTNATAPAINVMETEKAYKVEVAAPGMCKDDFDIHINKDNDLVITMEKKCKCTDGQCENKDGEKKEKTAKKRIPSEYTVSMEEIKEKLYSNETVDEAYRAKELWKIISNYVISGLCGYVAV